MKLIFGVHAVAFYNLTILYYYILRNLQSFRYNLMEILGKIRISVKLI